jgi:hypothetical protein
MPPPDHDPSVADAQWRVSIKRALLSIALVILVVLFNLGLYISILLLVSHGIIKGSLFPALVLFLSFALSLAIILIVALGEKIDVKNTQNELIKKVGVTPIMTVVAALITILAGFSPLAKGIFPESELKFMLANVGVTCLEGNPKNPSQATHLLSVVTSADEDYIDQVTKFLNERPPIRIAKNLKFQFPTIQFISNKQRDELDLYQTLHEFADSGAKGSEGLTDDLSNDERWVAYAVKINDPKIATYIPIPTIFDRRHKSRLLIVVNEPPKTKAPEVASLDAPVGQGVAFPFKKSIRPMFQVEILPAQPSDQSEVTDLQFKVFADQRCWNIGR